MTDQPAPPPVGPRALVGVLCAIEALALLGLAAFYLYELSLGEGSDPTRVVMSAVVILLGGVALAAMARGWFLGRRWVRMASIVWHLLLLPVGFTLSQGGQRLLGGSVLIGALVAVIASLSVKDSGAPADDDA